MPTVDLTLPASEMWRHARGWFGRNWHLAALGVWALGWFLIMAPGGGIAWVYFEKGTAGLFGGTGKYTPPGGLHLYASNPYLQIGPAAFAVAEVLRHLGPDNGVVTAEVLLAAAGLYAVVAIERLAWVMRPDLASRPLALRLTVLIGGAAFLNAWTDLAVSYTHLDDGLALLLAVAAVRAVVAGRPVLAGVCVGLAADAKPWALVFLPVVLMLPARAWWRAIAAAVVMLAAGWLPFLLADSGTITAARYAIPNTGDSALRALGITSPETPGWDRPARIALDPGVHGYYTAGILIGALIWDTAGPRRPWPLWSLLSIFVLSGVPKITRNAQVLGDTRLALILAFTATLLLIPEHWTWPLSPGAAHPAEDPRSATMVR
jgi:hypothetical protein